MCSTANRTAPQPDRLPITVLVFAVAACDLRRGRHAIAHALDRRAQMSRDSLGVISRVCLSDRLRAKHRAALLCLARGRDLKTQFGPEFPALRTLDQDGAIPHRVFDLANIQTPRKFVEHLLRQRAINTAYLRLQRELLWFRKLLWVYQRPTTTWRVRRW